MNTITDLTALETFGARVPDAAGGIVRIGERLLPVGTLPCPISTDCAGRDAFMALAALAEHVPKREAILKNSDLSEEGKERRLIPIDLAAIERVGRLAENVADKAKASRAAEALFYTPPKPEGADPVDREIRDWIRTLDKRQLQGLADSLETPERQRILHAIARSPVPLDTYLEASARTAWRAARAADAPDIARAHSIILELAKWAENAIPIASAEAREMTQATIPAASIAEHFHDLDMPAALAAFGFDADGGATAASVNKARSDAA